MKIPPPSLATVLAVLIALLFARPAGAQTAPSIITEPESVATSTNGAATFTVSFAGSTTMVSDWYLGGKYVFGTTNYGVLAATNSLVLPDVSTTNAGSYIVVITNDWGRITSSVVTLTITNTLPLATNSAPVILSQPQSVGTTNGATATFTVSFAGSTNLVSDWYLGGQYVFGTTNYGVLAATNSLVLPDVSTTNAGSYIVVITNDWGSVTSSVAVLTVTNVTTVTNTPPPVTNSAPIILSQPQNIGTTNGATATFTVSFTGSTNLVSDWYLSGKYVFGTTNYGVQAATNSLVLPNVSTTNAGSYIVVITNDWGSVTSSVAVLTVTNVTIVTNTPPPADSAPVILSQPQSVGTTNGATAAFTVSFAGSTTMVSDWYLSGKYVFGTTNYGALAATNSLVLPDVTATNAGSYIVVITNDWGRITSSVVTLTITNTPPPANSAPVILSQPQSVGTTNGATAAFTVSFAGSPTMVSDWYLGGKYVFGTTNYSLLAATNSLLLPDVGATNAGSYIVVITNDWGRITSSVVTLTITNTLPPANSAPVILSQPQSVGTTNGATAAFTVSFAGSTTMVSDWYLSGKYVFGTTNYGVLAATNSLVLPDVTATNAGSYIVVITNDWGRITSSVVTLTITNMAVVTNTPPPATNFGPTILSQPQSIATTNGATATFTVSFAGSTNLVSDWYFNGQYVFGTTNHGVLAATNSLVLPDVGTTNAGSYIVIITNDWGSVTSSVAALTVTLPGNGNPQISILPGTSQSVTLNLLTPPGTSSRLWVATNLCPPVIWMPIATNVSGTNGIWQFTDTNASQYPVRLFRTSTP